MPTSPVMDGKPGFGFLRAIIAVGIVAALIIAVLLFWPKHGPVGQGPSSDAAVSAIEVVDDEGVLTSDRKDPVDFGTTPQGKAVSKVFMINNTGTAPFTLHDLSLPDGFSPIGAGFASSDAVPPGGSTVLIVQMNAGVSGIWSGTLSFQTTVSGQPEFAIPIRGIVTSPRMEVHDGPILITNGMKAPVDFGRTPFGVPVLKIFTLANTGTSPLKIGDLSLSQGFTIVGAGFASLVVPPNGSTTLAVKMDANSSGISRGIVSFTTNSLDEPVFRFSVQGIVEEK